MFSLGYVQWFVLFSMLAPAACKPGIRQNLDPASYTPNRTRRASGEMQAIIPGIICPEPEECWLSLPAERSAAFLPTFARISMALQTILRDRVPAVYFQRQERFR